MTVLDCTDPETLAAHLQDAAQVLGSGGLVVLPTDTVYGIGADAFDKDAVTALLAAKGRGRQKPPPVLVPGPETLEALAVGVRPVVRDLLEAFWPGALTVVLKANPALQWDLGYTRGTVALRMPDDDVALALLRLTGPLAVSSANRTTQPPATTAQEALEQLGARVARYLDAGPAPVGEPSTIVDATGPRLLILREGAIPTAELAQVAPELLEENVPEPAPGAARPAAEEAGASDTPVSDESAPDAAVPDGPAPDAVVPDGPAPDAVVPDDDAQEPPR